MPARPRLDLYRSIEVTVSRLSPRIGCGLMLAGIPPFESADALMNVLSNYGYNRVLADRPAQKLVANPGLLKSLYENCFNNRVPLRQNFRQVYGHLDVFLACDPSQKTVWFVSDPHNKMALVNYYRDAVSLTLKADGRLLLGSTPRLTPVGWQNLHDLLTDEFFKLHRSIERVEIMSVAAGVRWRQPTLGLGLPMLNLKDLAEIQNVVGAAIRGESGTDIHT
ncbi:hypothetical protein FJY71_06205 [candidate division WOR-3 bacterium]|nr:hypothetical protein [candidate division WOR-3 bacterium]